MGTTVGVALTQPMHIVVGTCTPAHADKNQHRAEEAHAVFQEIQNAYEVLADKHERAW
jgi:hypothetical protein